LTKNPLKRSRRPSNLLSNPATASDFDVYGGVNEVLKEVGLTVADGGGKLTFYGQDPIIPSRFRFGSMAAIGLAATSVAVAALWKHRTGEGQDVSVDVRKALRVFAALMSKSGRPSTVGRPLRGATQAPHS
jgi:hypothetical protein